MKRIRVLVVEDSLTVRKRLCEVLAAEPDLEVVGDAKDGRRAIELCQELRPDVVTMDMALPVMDGLTATEYIMAFVPTPILVVSASTNRGELLQTYDALAAGAVEVLEKPRGDEPDGHWERKFVADVKLVSRIRVITHPRGRLEGLRTKGRLTTGGTTGGTTARREPGTHRIAAIGASTGGPGAVVELLRNLPAPFPVPVLLALHLGAPFGDAFAEWLDGETDHRALFAQDGQPVSALAGKIVLAPPDRHLIVANSRLRLTKGPERHSCRPSIDVLFESLAAEYGAACVACLLTGMGCDGAQGLLALRRAGGFTMAQDEATSVVYGMPREAALIGAACRVLPLAEIGAHLAELRAPAREGGP